MGASSNRLGNMTALAPIRSDPKELKRGATKPKKKKITKEDMPRRLQLRVPGMRTMRVRSRNVLDVDAKPMARVPIPSLETKSKTKRSKASDQSLAMY